MFEFDGYDFHGINKTKEIESSLVNYRASCAMMRSIPRYNSYITSIVKLMLLTGTIFRLENKILSSSSNLFLKLEDIDYCVIKDTEKVEFDYNEEQVLYLCMKYNLKYNDNILTDIHQNVTRICDRNKND